MNQGWRNYQKRWKRHNNITRKTPLILLLISFIIFILAGSPFLDTSNLSQRINYTIEENGLRLRFDENNVSIEGDSKPLFRKRAVLFSLRSTQALPLMSRSPDPELVSMEGEAKTEDKFITNFGKDIQIVYTIDPLLQEKITKLFAKYRVPYGAFVALSPRTGKVLAMVEHSEEGGGPQNLALRATYPAASIFKLITAAAGIEKGKIEPDTVIRYSGGLYSLTPKNWVDNPRRDKNKITLADALGKSCNVAFAKVALRWLGADELLSYAERFGFNKPVDFELPAQVSKAYVENTQEGIAKTAAGFGNITLSPLHGAMIAAAIANDGRMVAPRIIDKITISGRDLYNFKTGEAYDCISPITASKIKYMMLKTVESGTSKHAFYTRRGKAYLKDITVGGKTGSLEGDDPPGDYSWFVGMAPLEDPEIAIAVLVINKPVWQIKAPLIAREGLLTYFKERKGDGSIYLTN